MRCTSGVARGVERVGHPPPKIRKVRKKQKGPPFCFKIFPQITIFLEFWGVQGKFLLILYKNEAFSYKLRIIFKNFPCVAIFTVIICSLL